MAKNAIKKRKPFVLSDEDKAFLKENGYEDGDMLQIEKAVAAGRFFDPEDNEITAEQTIDLVGRASFLGASARAAFHFSAVRPLLDDDDSRMVYFDFTEYFKK